MRFLRYGIPAVVVTLAFVNPAFAADGAEGGIGDYQAIAAAFGIAIAALGGALGQGKAASAALEGISRNPGASGSMFTPMILGLVFIESLVIYALVISLKLVGLF